jgi:transcriptional regulator with XRE-family HTH domain
MTENENLGQRIRRLREAANLTQPELAARAVVPLGTLRNWEQGTRVPMAPAIVKLARALGVTADELLGTGS